MLLKKTNSESLELFFMMLWSFWHRWNKWIIHDINTLCEPRMFIAHAVSLRKGYKEALAMSNTLAETAWTLDQTT